MARNAADTTPFTLDGVVGHVSTHSPLRTRRDPYVAAVIGFLFGGIGLAIYLRSWVDFVVPVVLAVVLSLLGEMSGVMAAAVLVASYGYYRVHRANQDLEDAEEQRRASGGLL